MNYLLRVTTLGALVLVFTGCQDSQNSRINRSGTINNNQTPQTPPVRQNQKPAASNNIGLDDENFASFFAAPEQRQGTRVDDDFIPFASDSDQAIADLNVLKRVDADAVPFTRYISLSYLDFYQFKERGKPGNFGKEKTKIINSLSVTLNSLSTDDVITKPEPINDQMSLFRIDLRDYNWSRDQFDRIFDGSPNGDANKVAYPYNIDFDANLANLQQDLGTQFPLVRADFLIFEAGKAGTYYDLLQIDNDFFKEEAELGVARLNNIKDTIQSPESPRAVRAALGNQRSGVSNNNRIVERHDAAVGAFWISYDFLAAEGVQERDIFASPVGPLELGNLGELKGFEPDGGEAFFNLRNGLQGYALVNAANAIVNEAPIEVVQNVTDRRRNTEIRNGFVCWSCHKLGVLPASDEMRGFVENLGDAARDDIFNDDAVDAINAMHLPEDEFNKIVAADSKVHTDAMKRAQMLGTYTMGSMADIGEVYEVELTFDQVASELNLTEAQLQRVLDNSDNEVIRQALFAAKNGGLQRLNFEQIFQDVLNEVFRRN